MTVICYTGVIRTQSPCTIVRQYSRLHHVVHVCTYDGNLLYWRTTAHGDCVRMTVICYTDVQQRMVTVYV